MMKKKILIFVFLLFVLLSFYIFLAKTAAKSENIDYKKLYVKDLSQYPDELREKYPDLLNVRWGIKNRFEIRKNTNNLYGVYDKKKKQLIIPYKYSNITQCQNYYGMFFHIKDKNNEKIIDYKDNIVFQSNKYNLNCTNTIDQIITTDNNKYGFVTYAGKESAKPIFDSIYFAYPSQRKAGSVYIFVKKNNLYSIVDENNKTIIPFQDKQLQPMMYFLFKTINKDKKEGVIDVFGNTIIDNEYDSIIFEAPPFPEYYFKVRKGNLWGIINLKGDIEVPCKFKAEQLGKKLTNGRFTMNIQSSDGDQASYRTVHLVNQDGKILTQRPYYNIYKLVNSDKLFGTMDYNSKEDKILYGLITRNGEVLIEPSENMQIISTIEDKLVIVMNNKKFGLIYNNDILLPIKYGSINYKKGFIFIEANPIKFKKENFQDYKVPAQNIKNLQYYIITPDELIRIKGDLKNQELYNADSYQDTDENCFKIEQQSGLVIHQYKEKTNTKKR